MSNKEGCHDGKNFDCVKNQDKYFKLVKNNLEEIECLSYLIDRAETNYFCNKCGNIVTDIVESLYLKYCPYCGNKIK